MDRPICPHRTLYVGSLRHRLKDDSLACPDYWHAMQLAYIQFTFVQLQIRSMFAQRHRCVSAQSINRSGMLIANIHDAKTNFSKLIDAFGRGEEIVIAKAGKPAARLVSIQPTQRKSWPGALNGKMHIAEDFDAPLPDTPFGYDAYAIRGSDRLSIQRAWRRERRAGESSRPGRRACTRRWPGHTAKVQAGCRHHHHYLWRKP